MFGLTLGGEQMLFFSIAHTFAPMVLLVFLSFPTGLAWLLQSITALTILRHRLSLGLSTTTLALFTACISFHAASLLAYETWSHQPATRVIVCLVGIASSVLVIRTSWLLLRSKHGNVRSPGKPRGA